MSAGKAIYVADMGACTPKSALADVPTDNRWQVVAYDAGLVKGRMLCAQSLVQAPEVTLPLNLHGWHAVSIGFWPGIYYDSRIKYRLSGEQIFTVIDHRDPGAGTGPAAWDRTELVESFPRYADVTGQDIVFAKQHHSHQSLKAFIAYVKLEPLSDAQVQAVIRDRERRDTRRVLALVDGDGLFVGRAPSTKAELLEVVEPYRHSDVGLVFWGVNLGDLTYYRSRVGTFCYARDGAFALQGRREAAESHWKLEQQGVVPWRAAMDHVHAMGLEFHTYYRLSMYDHVGPANIFTAESTFLAEHPECRIVARDGTALPKASYAFPETRDFMVRLMEEAMETDVDGVSLCFVRGPEYFGYEQPILDDFRDQYGIDPRELPDDDERLLDVRAAHMTRFVRQVRRAAEAHGSRRGRPIAVSAWIEGSDERMKYFSYDSYRWIEEGLLDLVIADNPPSFLRLARDKGCRVFAQRTAGWAGTLPEQHVEAMQYALLRNLSGIGIWDIDACQSFPETWAVVSRLGHEQEVRYALPAAGYPRMKRVQLLSVAGRDISHTETRNVPGGWPPEMLCVYSGG